MALIKVHVWDGENRHEIEVGTYAKAEAFVTAHIGASEHAFGWIESPNGKHFTMVAGQTTRGAENLMGRDAWCALKPVTPVEVPMPEQPTVTAPATVVVEHRNTKGELIATALAAVIEIEFDYTDVTGGASHRKAVLTCRAESVDRATGEKHTVYHAWATLRPDDKAYTKRQWDFRHFRADRMANIQAVGYVTPEHPCYGMLLRIAPVAKILKARAA